MYLAWSRSSSCCGTRTFSRSLDGGASFESPIEIQSSPQWGTIDVAPDGTVYLAGTPPLDPSTILVARSSSARDAAAVPQFESVRKVNLGGTLRGGLGLGSPNPDGYLGQVWVAADPTRNTPARWIYMLASVDPPGPDPLDVMFARSTDGGNTWSAPRRLHDDGVNAWQWFGTLAVAPNGRLDAVWNDTRGTGAMRRSRLHYATSYDGGSIWSASTAVSPEWDSHLGWPSQNKIGDYMHLASDRVGATLVYAATFNGEQDIWCIRIGDYDCNANGRPDRADIDFGTGHDVNRNGILDECEGITTSVGTPNLATRFELLPNVPNPCNPATTLPFVVPAPGARVQLQILDLAGRRLREWHLLATGSLQTCAGTAPTRAAPALPRGSTCAASSRPRVLRRGAWCWCDKVPATVPKHAHRGTPQHAVHGSKPVGGSMTADPTRAFVRHTIATLAYRGAKILRGVPAGFGDVRAGDPSAKSRSAAEILAHIGDLLDWTALVVAGEKGWRASPPGTWEHEVEPLLRRPAERGRGAHFELHAFHAAGEDLPGPHRRRLHAPGTAGAPAADRRRAGARRSLGALGSRRGPRGPGAGSPGARVRLTSRTRRLEGRWERSLRHLRLDARSRSTRRCSLRPPQVAECCELAPPA